jgi:hypothetical protein
MAKIGEAPWPYGLYRVERKIFSPISLAIELIL